MLRRKLVPSLGAGIRCGPAFRIKRPNLLIDTAVDTVDRAVGNQASRPVKASCADSAVAGFDAPRDADETVLSEGRFGTCSVNQPAYTDVFYAAFPKERLPTCCRIGSQEKPRAASEKMRPLVLRGYTTR